MVRSGAMNGFGVIAFPTGSSVVCKVVGLREEALDFGEVQRTA